jgi:hypothetical protein
MIWKLKTSTSSNSVVVGMVSSFLLIFWFRDSVVPCSLFFAGYFTFDCLRAMCLLVFQPSVTMCCWWFSMVCRFLYCFFLWVFWITQSAALAVVASRLTLLCFIVCRGRWGNSTIRLQGLRLTLCVRDTILVRCPCLLGALAFPWTLVPQPLPRSIAQVRSCYGSWLYWISHGLSFQI